MDDDSGNDSGEFGEEDLDPEELLEKDLERARSEFSSRGYSGPPSGQMNSGRVRIIGAEQAGAVTPPAGFAVTDDPLTTEVFVEPSGRAGRAGAHAAESSVDEEILEGFDEQGGTEPLDLSWSPAHGTEASATDVESDPRPSGVTELPHWTDPPTGQVPAVLARDESDLPEWQRRSDTGPVWRERERDWYDPGGFEPSSLANEETQVGELRIEGADDEEQRRPWEFGELGEPEEVSRRDVRIVGPASGEGAAVAGGFAVSEGIERLASTSESERRRRDRDAELESESAFERASADLAGTGSPSSGRTEEDDGDEGADDDPSPSSGLRKRPVGRVTTISSSTRKTPGHVPQPQTGPGRGRRGRKRRTTGNTEFSFEPDDSESGEDLEPESAPSPGGRLARGAAGMAGAAARRVPGGGRAQGAVGVGTLTPSAESYGNHAGDGGAGRNLPVAIATGVAVAAIALLAMYGGPLPTVILATVIVTLCAAEAYGTLRRSGRRGATVLGIIATAAVVATAYAKGPSAIPFILVLLVAGTMLWYLLGVERGSPVEGVSSTVFVFVWVGVFGSFAGLLLSPSQFPDRHGVAFFAGAIVAAALNDIGALAAGRVFGRHLLAPDVSPSKTWEGLAGGAVLAILGSALITARIHPWTTEKAILLGVVVAIVAPLGDLCESLIKRDLKLKDMGNLLPGHGGLLDRFDALLWVLPATYFLVRVLHLG